VPKIETSFAGAYLFGAGEGLALIDRIEERIDALPGMAGLRLVHTAIREATAHVLAEEGAVPPAGQGSSTAGSPVAIEPGSSTVA
jgi:hypothetical protein